MITDALINNFKCFQKLTIPELGRVTLVSGRNNVGKTALLEGLFLFLDRIRADMVLRQYGWRGIEGVSSDPDAMWAPIFYNHDMSQEILISASIDGKREDARFRFNRNFLPPAPPSDRLPRHEQQISTNKESPSSVAIDAQYTDEDGARIQLSHLSVDQQGQPYLHIEYARRKAPPAIFLAAKKHMGSQETTNRFSKFVKEGREHEVVEFLKVIEPRLEGLTVITEGPASLVHGRLRGVSGTREIHLMGEGMEKLLNLVLAVAASRGGCVFLDEMENGLHYTGLPQIWSALGKALRDYDCQLFTTTHSYECIQAAHKGLAEMREDFRHIRLERKGEEISAKLSNYEMIEAAIKANLEVR
jgi:hypothetical protein